MKKRFFLLVLGLVFGHDAPAQVTIGAFGDLNFSNLSGDAPDEFSYGG